MRTEKGKKRTNMILYFIYNKSNKDIVYKSPDKAEVWDFFYKNCNEELYDIKEFEDSENIVHEYYCGTSISRNEFDKLLRSTI